MATYESKANDIKVEKKFTPIAAGAARVLDIGFSADTFSTEGDLTDRGFPSSTEGMDNLKIDNVTYDSAYDDDDEEISIFVTYPTAERIDIPEGLGTCFTFMDWQRITDVTSDQYALREEFGMNFDEEGFAKIKDRYVVATTSKFGEVGTCLDVVMENGEIVQCVIGDVKNQKKDTDCNEWGHLQGQCVVEFVVDRSSWYTPDGEKGDHVNPGTNDCHPEWNTVKYINKLDMNFRG